MRNLILGDCLEKLKELEDNSVDAIVTDPPYHLVSIVKRFGGENSRNTPAMETKEGGVFARKAKGFMGKEWDGVDENGMGIAMNVEMWAECLRVLKPGGHLLAFSGTRTYHRMAVAIEDAGFEVRDMIEWIYSTGFPKSLNIGKAVDKLQGNEREVVDNPNTRDRTKHDATTVFTSQEVTGWDKTKGTSEWEGWGTALKPAHEPICMARKPLAEKTVALNVLKYGTGGINIDESRVSGEGYTSGGQNKSIAFGANGLGEKQQRNDGSQGRFPANLIHDNSEEVRECFPESNSGNGKASTYEKFGGQWGKGTQIRNEDYGDKGNASRFFKSIKTDKICSLCCLPFNDEYTIMSVCKNTNVNNVEKSLETTQVITESTALKSATQKASENLAQTVKSVGNLCDLCGTYIAQWIVEPKTAQNQESILGQVSITEPKLQILKQCLASFVGLRGNTDTIPTMENLNLLFGYVFNAIESYTLKCEDTKNEDKNQWKSLIYKSKASKAERNAGCEELEEKISGGMQGTADQTLLTGSGNIRNNKAKNNHPTVKPIALMEYLIKMVTPKGGVVLDPFMGSGTTGVACKNLNRHFIGIEKDDNYFVIAKKRIEEACNLFNPPDNGMRR